jgi:hypothetical protein
MADTIDFTRKGWFVMTTSTFRPLAIGTLAFLMFAGNALSQAASPVVNTLEVQKLVANSEPADHAKLSVHFAALADLYAADARRHDAMARSFAGNPNRNTGSGTNAHCRKLSELNTQSAATLRELATHHDKLASGAPSTPPRDGARFQAGAGAPKPTDQELNALAAKANTPADHRALAEYFQTQAKRYTADATAHAAIAQSYRGTQIAHAADHCDRIVAFSRDAAKEATEAAAMHNQLAGVAR